METDNSSLEWNIRSLMVSLFQVAFSEIEANVMSVAQIVNCINETEMPLNNREEEITGDDECAAFYKSVRDAEYNILVDAYAREKIIKEEKERNRIPREQEKIISTKELTDDHECAVFYKSIRDADYNKLVDAYAREKIIKEEKVRNRIPREQEKIISTKELTDDHECAAFYKSVRDAEYNKLVDAYAREKIIKEEKERNMIPKEQEKIISTKELTDDHECAVFYKSIRDADYNKLVDAYAREKIIKEEKVRNRIPREQEKIISTKELTDDHECAAFYKSVRDAEYNKLVDAYAREKIIKEEKERNMIPREQEKIISTKEITDDHECASFYKSVRDAEYNKLVDAYAKEKTIKEEKERNRILREQEEIKKQFAEFWKPATDIDSLRRVSQEPKDNKEKALTSQQELHLKEEQVEIRQPGPFLSPVKKERINSFVREQHYSYQSFQTTDMRNAAINNIPDTSRTSDSEWFSISLSDTEETPRPHLRPFFSPLLEDIHVSTITSKTKESEIDIEVDFQSKPNSGFTSFRQWLCQLFCCHSKPDADFDN
ncbi:uncharacterized protein LOC143069088 isoform X2 [Mytilus galloprovincialis]|uniref:uncharacterized protein LOC143069088 isoform X2 n=1 Tax=Mytilus galloprovincialis TaxID=29158 RepID=UPI003F7BCAAE